MLIIYYLNLLQTLTLDRNALYQGSPSTHINNVPLKITLALCFIALLPAAVSVFTVYECICLPSSAKRFTLTF